MMPSLLLAACAGLLDAVAYLRLGEALVANMTGNTVLLGAALGGGKWGQALRHAAALAGFVVGAFLTARFLAREPHDALAARRQARILAAQTVLLGLVALAWWIVRGPATGPAVRLPVLAALATAMGAQATLAYIGASPRLPVNFDTGLLLTLVGRAAGTVDDTRWRVHTGVIVALLLGALAGALLARAAVQWALVAALLLVAIAWLGSRAGARAALRG